MGGVVQGARPAVELNLVLVSSSDVFGVARATDTLVLLHTLSTPACFASPVEPLCVLNILSEHLSLTRGVHEGRLSTGSRNSLACDVPIDSNASS